jgi:hypothetical protein
MGARPAIFGRRTVQMARIHAMMGIGPNHDHQLMVFTRKKPPPTATAICAGV